MTNFPAVPVSGRSKSLRRLIFGVGINDADYVTYLPIEGRYVSCPYYVKWHSMIRRCYSENLHESRPTYKGCYVCDEWLIFSNFRAWMIKQNWEGMHLDKDLLIQGNKEYSPNKCLFVTQEINTLTSVSKARSGIHHQGVYFNKEKGKFTAQCSTINGRVYLGSHCTSKAASLAYIKFKYNLIAEVASSQSEPLKSALLSYKIEDN